MIEVYLDNEQLEIAEDVSIGLTVSIASIEDPISASASFTQSIDVPRTAHNEAVFGHTEQILSPDIFNHSEHIAAIYEDGVELIKGKAYFEGATDTHYKVQIVGNEFDWLERIKDKKLNEIDSDTISQFREYETMTEEQRKAVFFALVEHGCWWQEVEDETIRRKWATYADLVPFVGLTAILRSIFKGYTIDAGSVTDFLTRLYVTGKWKASENADVLAEDNEWEVSCTGNNLVDVTANGVTEAVVGTKVTADNHGNEAAYCNVFDTVEDDKNNRIEVVEQSVEAGGETITHRVLSFAPSEYAITAYTMRLKYTTQMVVKGNTPIFADTIHFGGMPIAQVPYTDSVEALALNGSEALNGGFGFPKASYPKELSVITSADPYVSSTKAFVLELSNPELYTAIWQISWLLPTSGKAIIGKQKLYDEVKHSQIVNAAVTFDLTESDGAGRYSVGETQATIALEKPDGELIALINEAQDRATTVLSFQDFKGQAHLFFKSCSNYPTYRNAEVKLFKFGEEDTLTFDLQMLTPAFNVSTLEPADLSVGFTSSKATELEYEELLVSVGDGTLAPKFNNALPFGYPISLNDVGGETLATDMLKAIMHLFNLRIYANSDTKTVHILPYSEFYNNDVVDWSDRIDRDKGVEITTVGDNIGKALVLTYQSATPAVQEFNKRHKLPYLAWRTPLLNKRNNKEYGLENAVFTAPMEIDTAEIFPTTQWGGLLNMVDEEMQDTLDNLDYGNIPQVLVQTQTPTADPNDYIQYVGSTGLLKEYLQPDFVITDIEANTNIAFDDRNGVAGLHQHYDKQVDIWNYGKRITCYCRVEPQEVESLRKAGTSDVDFRSKFKLKINGEDIYCRLESIENYEPQNSTHKCTFINFS